MPEMMFNPREAFFLQWHITDRCNLKCTHCYRESVKGGLGFSELRDVFENFMDLRRAMPQSKARVQIAGGEPLLSEHLFPVLDMVAARGLQSRILTNGTLIDRRIAAEIKNHGCRIVQISIDGAREAHDSIRGEGNFERSTEAARLLRAEGVEVTFAMTLSRLNAGDIPRVFELAEANADRVSFQRLVPRGAGRAFADKLLRPAELLRVFRRIRELREEFSCCRRGTRNCEKLSPSRVSRFRRGVGMAGGEDTAREQCVLSQATKILDVPLRDPLWKPFFGCLGETRFVDGCSAGYAGICVESNGDVYPCRRMPVVIGNALQTSLTDIWCTPLMERLRDRDLLGGRCGKCALRWRCGGCRGVALALRGDAFAEDPQCFYRPSVMEKFTRRVFSLSADAHHHTSQL